MKSPYFFEEDFDQVYSFLLSIFQWNEMRNCFLKQLPITHTDEYASDTSNSIMKLIEIKSHGWYTNLRGCRRL
jgi:hypothetical protein